MAEIKSFRLREDRAGWLKAEADRAEVSQNKIVETLIGQAAACGWQHGRGELTFQPYLVASGEHEAGQ